MAESTLNLTLTDLQAGVAEYLGFSRDSTKWDNDKKAQIAAAIASGLRQFYFAPILPGQTVPHEWSFLQPVYTLPIRSGTADYELPDNFAAIAGEIVLVQSTMNDGYPIREVAPERIWLFRQNPDAPAVPRYAAIQTKVPAGASTPRYEIMFWPTPDASYEIVFRYSMIPNAISTDAPFAVCGVQHAETLLASCIAAAETMYVDGQMDRNTRYLQFLATSIARDASASAPDFIGGRQRRLRVPRMERRDDGRGVRIEGFHF